MIRKMLTVFLTVFTIAAQAQEAVVLSMNGVSFNASDSIEFSWNGAEAGMKHPLATMHLWIDNVQTGRRWKFRYPIVNGEAAGALAVSKDLEPGTYAFNFLGANHRLEVYGKMRNVRVKMSRNFKTGKLDTVSVTEKPGSLARNLRYTLMSQTGFLFDSVMRVDDSGYFRIPSFIYGDTARLTFNMEKERDDFMVEVVTPLDSSFTPFFSKTVFVTVKGKQRVKAADTAAYQFTYASPYATSGITLEEVKVSGLSKVQQFEKENVSSFFQSVNARTYDGLNSLEMSTYNDIWDYLRAHVVGMTVTGLGFDRGAMWRGQPVTFFLDEVMIDPDLIVIHPADVALIKAFPPSATMALMVSGAAVAIYSKRGAGEPRRPGYSYTVVGFTPGAAEWKPQY
ncbi:MAG: hypothetical protein WBP58_17565 [Chitinophagaceae bacterium]